MRTRTTTVILPLYILIQRSDDDTFPWVWFVTSERVPDGTRPYGADCVAWGFAVTRWTARWGAKRVCQRLGSGQALERWIYDPDG
jgi:hypothetical protein